ncbi:hypothetical protein ACVNIS_07210 [Sphaerotilaceae bacterium SBD11-9]
MSTNTATWVDEAYGRRLAQQMVQHLRRRDGEGSPKRLAQMRASRLFLREQPMRIGPGMKQGSRVWYLGPAPKTIIPPADADLEFLVPGLSIFTLDFDARGDLVPRSSRALCAVQVSMHALGRAFERLRTNDMGDVRRLLLVPLSEHDAPETLAADVEFSTEAGRCPAVAMFCRGNNGEDGLVWMVKTLLPHKG